MQVKILPKQIIRKEIDGSHYYFVGERHYPSVTHIIGQAAPKEYGLLNFFKTNSPSEIERIKDETAGFGTLVHEALEKLLYGVEIKMSDYNQAAQANIVQFSEWFYITKPEKYLPEQQVVFDRAVEEGYEDLNEFPEADRYGGTLDFLGEIEVGNLIQVPNLFTKKQIQGITEKYDGNLKHKLLCLIDFKTTSGIYYSHQLQLGAYKLAAEQMFGRKVDFCGILRLGTRHKSGYEMKMVDGVRMAEMYIKVFEIYKNMNGDKLPEPPEVEIYPETIKLVDARIEERVLRNRR